jgi:hypothetical protein
MSHNPYHNEIPDLVANNRQRKLINTTVSQLPPCRTREARDYIVALLSTGDELSDIAVREACNRARRSDNVRLHPERA